MAVDNDRRWRPLTAYEEWLAKEMTEAEYNVPGWKRQGWEYSFMLEKNRDCLRHGPESRD